jgi:putative two-component system response regulator
MKLSEKRNTQAGWGGVGDAVKPRNRFDGHVDTDGTDTDGKDAGAPPGFCPMEGQVETEMHVDRPVRARRSLALHGLRKTDSEIYLDTLNRLALASEYRDDNTGDHIARIGGRSALLARLAGLSAHEEENLRYAAPMHDVGKIGVPDKILFKSEALTRTEFGIMKSHTLIGARLLAESRSEVVELGQRIALAHHENWDGSGYPVGIAGRHIPLPGRIVRIVDAFDALVSRRPYKDAYPPEVALRILIKGRGSSFDPDLTDILVENAEAFVYTGTEEQCQCRGASRYFTFSQRDRHDFPDIAQPV